MEDRKKKYTWIDDEEDECDECIKLSDILKADPNDDALKIFLRRFGNEIGNNPISNETLNRILEEMGPSQREFWIGWLISNDLIREKYDSDKYYVAYNPTNGDILLLFQEIDGDYQWKWILKPDKHYEGGEEYGSVTDAISSLGSDTRLELKVATSKKELRELLHRLTNYLDI